MALARNRRILFIKRTRKWRVDGPARNPDTLVTLTLVGLMLIMLKYSPPPPIIQTIPQPETQLLPAPGRLSDATAEARLNVSLPVGALTSLLFWDARGVRRILEPVALFLRNALLPSPAIYKSGIGRCNSLLVNYIPSF
jgi:hypothetical protein